MKAILIVLAFLLSFTFNTSAQLPDGSIAPDFTTTDMNGNQHRLYDYLDQGYTVILDISATWCGPCWNYHSGGTFEEIWAAHGPAGEPGVNANTTDDVMILWFEGDDGTPESELENSDLGNWLEPNGEEVHFPIINDNNIADLYALPYWPIIYTICPNRTLTESGQATAANHYSNLDDCVAAFSGTNAALLDINTTIMPVGCEASASGNLSVIVQNMGTELLSNFSVELSANGQSIGTEDFSGSLETYQTTTIDFGNVTVDSETIEIEITTPDDNNADNNMSHSINFSNGQTTQKVTVNLLTDNYANEVYMEITDENDNVIWFEGNEANAGISGTGQLPSDDATNPLGNNQSYDWDVNLPSTGCFKFTIYDYYGDGLAASTNTNGGVDGNWSIENSNGMVIAEQMVQNFENTDDASFENTQAADPSSINEESNIALSVFPNPIQSDAKLSFSLTKTSNVRLDILNVLGETILSNDYSLQPGNNNLDINVDRMTNGIYFAHLTINGVTNTVKITVSK